ncbi:MAG TPA: endopeptidase La [Acidobacteriota bacterium]|nr:endopeptidase La [Acidobacteriota bacterium]
MNEHSREGRLPLLPVKNNVLFPYLLMPLSVGRPQSIAAVEAAVENADKELVVVAQKDGEVEAPRFRDLFKVGTLAQIKKIARSDEEAFVEVTVQGVERIDLLELTDSGPYLEGRYSLNPIDAEVTPECEALHREVLDLTGRALSLATPQAPAELGQLLGSTDDPLRLVFLLGSLISLGLEKEQRLLEAEDLQETLHLMYEYLKHEVEVLELRRQISSQAKSEMSREHREYFLRQQMRAIQDELGESDSEEAEVNELRERLEKADLPEIAQREVEKELSRLTRLSIVSPEYNVVRSYLDFVLELPWSVASKDQLEIARVRSVLDQDHFNLTEVKQRILEHLGVLKLNPGAKAPILCFVGPPGVGKTSLGRSIARAMDRRFERLSLGGMHDEAELRGHRRTYIGAMPGRILNAIRRSGVNNPVLMLDEIDKLGRDFRGDPASALLEILDPEQNRDFRDNYLDLPWDLSRVFFITTANTLDNVPAPLLDRLEILRLSGYSAEEKIQIARRFLIPRRLSEAGLRRKDLVIETRALRRIITRYTREAGVRRLEQALGRLARKVALRFAEGDRKPVRVKSKDLADMLGPERFFQEEARKKLPPGVATGLAWTEAGGDVLYVEATRLPQAKELKLTGQLGDIMKESAQAAQSYIWSHSSGLKIDEKLFTEAGVHVHVPAGAIPKDGPSAGITLAVAMASLYTGVPARADTAMTGEVTLTGLVLPVGGMKEKILAARRARLRRVILPKENEKDLKDLPDRLVKEMDFIFVGRVEEVLEAAFESRARSASKRSKGRKQAQKEVKHA